MKKLFLISILLAMPHLQATDCNDHRFLNEFKNWRVIEEDFIHRNEATRIDLIIKKIHESSHDSFLLSTLYTQLDIEIELCKDILKRQIEDIKECFIKYPDNYVKFPEQKEEREKNMHTMEKILISIEKIQEEYSLRSCLNSERN